MIEKIRRSEKPIKKLGGKLLAPTMLFLSLALAQTACGNATINADRVFVEGTKKTSDIATPATLTTSEAAADTPKPPTIGNTYKVVQPETTLNKFIAPDWARQLVSSEIYIPNDGTKSINRRVGPNQIVAMSGGPMTIDYVDQNGTSQILSFDEGPSSVTLIFFLGNQKKNTFASVRGVVPLNNWAGTYDVPNGNPANRQYWQSLLTAKVDETMAESTSVSGGAKIVNVVVLDGNRQIAHKERLTK